MALQLISPPKKPAPLEVVQGCDLPPLKGLDRFVVPQGASLEWIVETAWSWRNSNTRPKLDIPVRVPSESHLLEMERVSPNVAAHYRRQIAETIAGNKRRKLTRTIARVQQLIVDQYGWPERE